MPAGDSLGQSRATSIGLLLLGGPHHILHLIPVAIALVEREGVTCCIFVTTEAEARYCNDVLLQLGSKPVEIIVLTAPPLLRKMSHKLSLLLWNIKKFHSVDCLLVAERTSTFLKRLPISLPPMFHIPHGAGDRARSYDKRIALFDHVIVAGPKDKRRMMELDLVTEDSCTVSGYIKAAALRAMNPERAQIFQNDKPTVIYNPHFSEALSSWPVYGLRLLDYFAAQAEYNLIFAPHIRLFAKASGEAIKEVNAYGHHGHIHVDLGSDRLTDMTYTRAADIYLGDVSSQVYEFMITPAPSIFLGQEEFNWTIDPDYAHWRYGQVCFSFEDFETALAQARAKQSGFEAIQIEGRGDAFGDPNWDALDRAADAVIYNL